METFKVRALKPTQTDWVNITAESSAAAAQTFHYKVDPEYRSLCFHHVLPTGGHENVKFALIEVEGHEPVVSRLFCSGIWRKGRRSKQEITLNDIASELGWTHPIEDLLSSGWDCEE